MKEEHSVPKQEPNSLFKHYNTSQSKKWPHSLLVVIKGMIHRPSLMAGIPPTVDSPNIQIEKFHLIFLHLYQSFSCLTVVQTDHPSELQLNNLSPFIPVFLRTLVLFTLSFLLLQTAPSIQLNFNLSLILNRPHCYSLLYLSIKYYLFFP